MLITCFTQIILSITIIVNSKILLEFVFGLIITRFIFSSAFLLTIHTFFILTEMTNRYNFNSEVRAFEGMSETPEGKDKRTFGCKPSTQMGYTKHSKIPKARSWDENEDEDKIFTQSRQPCTLKLTAKNNDVPEKNLQFKCTRAFITKLNSAAQSVNTVPPQRRIPVRETVFLTINMKHFLNTFSYFNRFQSQLVRVCRNQRQIILKTSLIM